MEISWRIRWAGLWVSDMTFKLAKILGHLGPMTSLNGKNAISRDWSFAERSMTPHWIGNLMENTMEGVMMLQGEF